MGRTFPAKYCPKAAFFDHADAYGKIFTEKEIIIVNMREQGYTWKQIKEHGKIYAAGEAFFLSVFKLGLG